jgi:hypothetical protein
MLYFSLFKTDNIEYSLGKQDNLLKHLREKTDMSVMETNLHDVEMCAGEPCHFFMTAEEALHWAVEVLRRRRLPALSAFWKSVKGEVDDAAQSWGMGGSVLMPTDPQDRMALAMTVDKALATIGTRDPAHEHILRLWAWGDWADDARLQSALAFQERCRREGTRVRIAYRYSYEQLGFLLKCDKKTAWRRVQEALKALQDELNIQPSRAAHAVSPVQARKAA